jgi:hypothetical protein
VTITGLAYGLSPLLLNEDANVTLTLEGENTLTAGAYVNAAGIQTTGATLVINGSGELTATGAGVGAGIGGGGSGDDGGTIIINGGTVNAIGGAQGAGIGGGSAGDGGNIKINSGDVTAKGGEWGGAGIGGGDQRGDGGTITITGGMVNATGGGWSAWGIGGAGIGGGDGGYGGTITITGTPHIIAIGVYVSGIGHGAGGTRGTLNITGVFDVWLGSDSTRPDVVAHQSREFDGGNVAIEFSDASNSYTELSPLSTFIITAIAGTGGSITPSGAIEVQEGDDKTFTISANTGYRISEVKVDGESVGGVSSYTFSNVTESHTIEAEFTLTGGEVDPTPLPPPPPTRTPTLEPEPESEPEPEPEYEEHLPFIQGIGNNLFAPNSQITRAHVAQIFYNILRDYDNVEPAFTFPDVAEDAWYAEAVNKLAAIALIEGYTDGTFRPERSITRAEFVAIVVRFMGETPDGSHVNIFVDVQPTHWAYEYISMAADAGWIVGYEDGTFRPNQHITRAEAVTLVNRLLNRIPDLSYIRANIELPRFDDVPPAHWAYYEIMEAFIPHSFVREADGTEMWRGTFERGFIPE